jgi:hypothetical protein
MCQEISRGVPLREGSSSSGTFCIVDIQACPFGEGRNFVGLGGEVLHVVGEGC